MKLKEGMMLRTKKGTLHNIDEISSYTNRPIESHYYSEEDIKNNNIGWKEFIELDNITKASYNIIDLIKSKDIILGKDGKLYQCWKVYKDYVFTYSKNKQGQTITLVDYQIDRIMCYEQFESMSYKVGD